MGRSAAPPRAGWVVCEGATRPVMDAVVRCPLRGPVAAVECLGCHLLVTSSVERRNLGWCVAETDSAVHGKDERVGAALS